MANVCKYLDYDILSYTSILNCIGSTTIYTWFGIACIYSISLFFVFSLSLNCYCHYVQCVVFPLGRFLRSCNFCVNQKLFFFLLILFIFFFFFNVNFAFWIANSVIHLLHFFSYFSYFSYSLSLKFFE